MSLQLICFIYLELKAHQDTGKHHVSDPRSPPTSAFPPASLLSIGVNKLCTICFLRVQSQLYVKIKYPFQFSLIFYLLK